MKFNNLDELIDFEKGLEWVKERELNVQDYAFTQEIRTKYNRLKGEKLLGVHNGKIVGVVSDQFRIIKVLDIVEACDTEFGDNFVETSYKQGIVRVYDKGVEDNIGKVTPMVVYPANLGNMAVKIGLHHNAYVCSNGLIMADNILSQRIIHRLSNHDLEHRVKQVSDNLGIVLKRVSEASEVTIDKGLQLGMIVQGLGKKDGLIKKALKNYPETNSLWDTVQTITYVATHKTSNGYDYSKNAGNLLINQKLEPEEIVDAANYAFTKQRKGTINFENSTELYQLASEILA